MQERRPNPTAGETIRGYSFLAERLEALIRASEDPDRLTAMQEYYEELYEEATPKEKDDYDLPSPAVFNDKLSDLTVTIELIDSIDTTEFLKRVGHCAENKKQVPNGALADLMPVFHFIDEKSQLHLIDPMDDALIDIEAVLRYSHEVATMLTSIEQRSERSDTFTQKMLEQIDPALPSLLDQGKEHEQNEQRVKRLLPNNIKAALKNSADKILITYREQYERLQPDMEVPSPEALDEAFERLSKAADEYHKLSPAQILLLTGRKSPDGAAAGALRIFQDAYNFLHDALQDQIQTATDAGLSMDAIANVGEQERSNLIYIRECCDSMVKYAQKDEKDKGKGI